LLACQIRQHEQHIALLTNWNNETNPGFLWICSWRMTTAKISMWESYGSYDPSTWGFHSKSNLHQASFSEQSCQPGFTFKQLRLFQECMQNVTKFSALPSSLQAFPCQFTCCAFSSVSVSTGPATFITTQDLRLLWIAPTAEMLFENLA
jgi:hypothetical protein